MPPDLSIAFRDFAAEINGIIAETGVRQIKETSQEIAEEIEEFYYSFFVELHKAVSTAGNGTPSRFSSNMGDAGRWAPLSEKWSDRKLAVSGRPDFYYGLTGYLNKARRKSVAARRKAGKKGGGTTRGKKSFMSFLSDLAGSSEANVKKFFGPVRLTYEINARGRKTPVKIEQTENIIREIGRITSHDSRGRIMPNYDNVSLRAEISMFPLLATAEAFSEWYVVNQMAGKDSRNSKQWVKINSRDGFGAERPIRAMITPLVSWYATTGLTQIMRKFYT